MTQEQATAMNRSIEARKEAEQTYAEREVAERKAELLKTMAGLDVAENFDSEAVTQAIRIGDAELLGRLVLMTLDQFAERMAVRDIYGSSFVEYKEEAMGAKMVAEYLQARAGVTQ